MDIFREYCALLVYCINLEGSCCSFLIYRFCQCPDKRFIGQRFWFCLLCGLILTLMNVYWDETPMLLYLDLNSHWMFLNYCENPYTVTHEGEKWWHIYEKNHRGARMDFALNNFYPHFSSIIPTRLHFCFCIDFGQVFGWICAALLEFKTCTNVLEFETFVQPF